MAQLRICLLGPLHVTLDGDSLTAFESDKVRALLAYLAIEIGQPHRRERLAGLLWPNLPERAARGNLRVALSNLRKLLDDSPATPALRVDRQTVQLAPEADVWVDVGDFCQLSEAEGRPGKVAGSLRQAAELYRGDLLQGFSLPDSAGFEEWLLLQREVLQRRMVATLRLLAHWHERQGEYRRALSHARRTVEMEPWQESDRRRLMRLLTLTDQRNAALGQYQGLQRMLANDLSVEPEDETTALYTQIRAGQAPALASAPPRNNLPTATTPFIGREAELDAIYACLQDPGCRLLTLVGPGGSGKTRLALAVAADALSSTSLSSGRHAFLPADGVFVVSLAPLSSEQAIVPATAAALGFSFRKDNDPWQQLLDYLRGKAMLLIMDNFEHLLDGARLVAQVLKTAPHVKVLVTSRARLNMQAEYLFSIKGMALPASIAPHTPEATHELLGYDGLELFVTGARRVQPDFQLVPDNASDVVRVCRLVAGLPLAILMAAAAVERVAPADLAARLSDEMERGLDLLASGWQDVPERQRSMAAVFEHSWQLLTARQRQVLMGLSVFRGGFGAGAAQQVTGALESELEPLTRMSLLTCTPQCRYDMHELERQFLQAKLDRSLRTEESLRDRHSAYYCAALSRWAADLKGARQQAALAELRLDGENARAAWDWVGERGQLRRVAQATDGMFLFYRRQGRYVEAEMLCRAAAERLAASTMPGEGEGPGTEAASHGDRWQVLSIILAWQSGFLETLGRHEEARACAQQSLSLARHPSLPRPRAEAAEAFALLHRGHSELGSDPVQAQASYERCLALFRAQANTWGAASALYALGDAAWFRGVYGEARRMYEASLALRREMGDHRGVAECLVALSNTLPRQGELAEGVRLGQQGITIMRELDDPGGIVAALSEVGTASAFSGDFARAALMYKEALDLRAELGDRSTLSNATMALGHVEMHLGRYERAQARGETALAQARAGEQNRAAGNALFLLGSLAVVREVYTAAYELLCEGVDVTQAYGQQGELGRAQAALGFAALGLGRATEARALFCRALRLGAALGAWMPLYWSLAGLALLLAGENASSGGEAERAIEIYALAANWPVVVSSVWFKDVAGRRIEAIAVTLPPGVVAAARARGLACKVEATVRRLLDELDCGAGR